MKYVCLGYIEPGKLESMSESERNALVDACLAYDDVLRENGRFIGGEGLQPASNAATLRFRDGKVAVSDGPYAETKEFLGGYYEIECTDEEALEAAAKLPDARYGAVSVHPVQELELPEGMSLPAPRGQE